MNYIKQDNRILYDVGDYKYTVSDVEKIYQECKADIDKCDTNSLKCLYDFFQIKQKKKFYQSMGEIAEELSERIAIIANSGEIKKIRTEVRKCRRKFYYWGDLPACIYYINEQLDCYKTNRKFKDDIPIDKDYYDCWIALACYIILIEKVKITDERIEDDKLCRHKLDWEYTRSLKYFSDNYKIDENLELKTEGIFHNIYSRILKYGSLSFYEQIYKKLYNSFDRTEKRIRINNEENTELPTLLNYSLRALSESIEEAEIDIGDVAYSPDIKKFQELLMDTRHAIRLLDVNNEFDMEFFLSSDESVYLERIMKYSAVYDVHQYVPEGMLFLVRRIIDAYSKQLGEYYSCDSESLCNIIGRLVKSAQSDFEAGIISKIPFDSVSNDEHNILDLMAIKDSLNEEYYVPTQWNKVYSDSEWVIKRHDAYYIIPPIVSMLGIYDKIGKALNWVDFGPQIEKAVLDLFQDIMGLKEYSGKYLFENEVYECDAIILGKEYALIIECKRKGISRVARGGTNVNIIENISETYFSSQSQAYRMQRAIESLGKMVEFYPSKCKISAKKSHNAKYDKYKTKANFMTVKHFIRISCTGGNFWIASEGGIADHIEKHITEYNVERSDSKEYIDSFISEKNKLLASKSNEHEKKIIKLDKLFLSFDKLYDMVIKSPKFEEGGDALLKEIWKLTRIQSKKYDSANHYATLMSLSRQQ